MLRRVGAAACATFALVAVSRNADAAPVLRIEWPTIPGCPGSSFVVERARAAIVHAKQVDDVLAVAEVTPPVAVGGAWQVHLRTRTVHGTGERTLEAPTCDALARAAGLLVAVAALRARTPATERPIEELAPVPSSVEEPDVAARAVPLKLPSGPPPPPPPPPTTGSNEVDTRFSTSVGIGVASGLLPNIAVGPTASLGYETGEWSARVGLGVLVPQVAAHRGAGADFATFGASVDVCRGLPLPALAGAKTRACAGASIDDVHASGIGGLETFDVRRTAAMVFGGLGATWSIGRYFRIGADARLGASVLRPSFVLDSPAGRLHLHRPAAVRGEGTLTLGVVF